MKAVLALILIYIGNIFGCHPGRFQFVVEASGQAGTQGNSVVDPAKMKDIRSLLELVGARDAIEESASAATEQYRPESFRDVCQ